MKVPSCNGEDGRVAEEANILAAKREYAREKEKLKKMDKEKKLKEMDREKMKQAKDSEKQQIQPLRPDVIRQEYEPGSTIGKYGSDAIDPQIHHVAGSLSSNADESFQNVGMEEVEREIKSLNLADKKKNASTKHVTYEDDLVEERAKTEEKVQKEKSTTADSVEEEKKAKRRKMIENAKRKKAEAEARIEAEKAAEGARKKQTLDGDQAFSWQSWRVVLEMNKEIRKDANLNLTFEAHFVYLFCFLQFCRIKR